jgi:hypothetical protein
MIAKKDFIQAILKNEHNFLSKKFIEIIRLFFFSKNLRV